MSGYAFDPCERCEEMMQPYLDRELNDVEMLEAETHLDTCSYCRRRYRFEVSLRRYIRTATSEQMPAQLKQKLSELRIELH
jgi:anti-sigma factor (TIGR02949 family)